MEPTSIVPSLPSALYRDGRWFACFEDHQGHRRQVQTRATTLGEATRMAERLHAQERGIREVLQEKIASGANR